MNVEQERELREGFFTSTAPERGLYGRRRIAFDVIGLVVPQGSAKAFALHLKDGAGGLIYGKNGQPMTRTIVTSDNPALREWRRLVSDAARQAVTADFVLFTGPVALRAVFHLPRPKSAKKSAVVPTTRPDIDKCLRGILDALSNVIFRDDSQVYHVLCEKRYAAAAAPPSVKIEVEG